MSKCIVIGAGAIGLMSARFLAQAGFEVELIERGEVGRESSWAGGGIISPLYPWRYPDAVNRLADDSQRRYPELVAELRAETGIDAQLLTSGMLLLDAPEPEMDDWARQWGHQVERLDSSAAIQAVQPGIDPVVTQAIWLPDLMQIRNPRLLAALRASIEGLPGITVRTQTAVQSIAVEHGRAVGVETASSRIEGDVVLVSAGAWSSALLPEHGARFRRIEPVKGQMIQFRTEPGTLTRMIMRDSMYLIPRQDGRILAGSTLEHTGFEKTTSEEALARLRRFATEVVPALATAPVVHHWAGLRPGTDSGIPLIGPHPDVAGLFVNAGHYRNGIVIGLASTRLGVDLICGRTPEIDPGPYQLVRTA